MAGGVLVRARLVDALLAGGRVRTPGVAAAFRAVPRHLFLPELSIQAAYADEAVVVQHTDGVATSSASQPSMMAIMLEQLDVRPGHRVLEIGAGTGYNAALLAHLVGPSGAVTSVDIDADLVERATGHLRTAGVDGVELACADGAFGYPPGAPYDRIVLTVGSSDVRPEWVAQLTPRGRLLLPLTVRGSQVSAALDLGPDGALRSDSVRSCAFIRLRGAGAAPVPARWLPAHGLMLQTADGRELPDVDAWLSMPGKTFPVDVPLGAADLWDGLGLFLALTVAGACRLLMDTRVGARTCPLPLMAPGLGTVAVAGDDGLAVVVGSRHQIGALACGLGGGAQAARLLAAVNAWVAAGRPTAAGLRLLVRLRGGAGPDGSNTLSEMITENCRITAGW